VPPAVTLLQAADDTPTNLNPLWANGTLQAKVIAFWKAINPAFPSGPPENMPIENWISIIAAFAPSILPYAQEGTPTVTALVGLNTIATYSLAVDYIYRLCKFASFYSGEQGGTAFITPTQATALLTAYNAQFT
jgi:hypothetical protein